jgi:hypothetical protein
MRAALPIANVFGKVKQEPPFSPRTLGPPSLAP